MDNGSSAQTVNAEHGSEKDLLSKVSFGKKQYPRTSHVFFSVERVTA